MKNKEYDDRKSRLANMIIVGEKHDWGIDPITGKERQGRWTVTRQDIKNAFNSLANDVGSNHAVNNDLDAIKNHRLILAEAISIECISRLTKAELDDAEDMLHRYADDFSVCDIKHESISPVQYEPKDKKEEEDHHNRGIRF